MADLIITIADLEFASSDVELKQVVFGEAVTQNDLVYEDGNGKYQKVIVDSLGSPTTTTAKIVGAVIWKGSSSGNGWIITGGKYKPGATLTKGQEYVASANSNGKTAPRSDLATGDYISRWAIAEDTTTLRIDIDNSEVTVP